MRARRGRAFIVGVNPKVDAYLGRAKQWRAEMEALRAILLECGLTEELKWGKPCYATDDGNIAILQPFKAHCALMFFKGALLEDPHGLLVPQGENTRSAMRVEFTDPAQVTKKKAKVKALVKKAVQVEKAGLKVDFAEAKKPDHPEELTAALRADKALKKAFGALTPGRQRSWVLHFSSAKQAKTREARIEKAKEKIFAGKGWNER